MTPLAPCRLPEDLAQDIENHAHDVERFLKGELAPAIMKARRVSRGMYEQRQNGTYMVRARVPGGALSAGQARALARVASRYGSGLLHVTTRQDIQIHDVKIEETPSILRDLLAAGLTARGGGGNTVRNITACPFAGICPAEAFDVTPFVVAVTEYLIAQPGSYNLPRKYKIAFSGCAADCALASINDLGFIARARDGLPGFGVYAGGGMGSESRVADRMEEWVPAGDVIRIAEAVRRLFDRLGDRRNRHRARLRFAADRLGPEAFRAQFREAVAATTADGVPACSTPAALNDKPAPPPPDYRWLLTESADGALLRQRQSGYVAAPVRLPLGQIRWEKLESLADIAERYSDDRALGASQDQNLLLRFVRETDVPALRQALDALGDDPTRRATLHAFTACTGAATCRLGLCLAQNAAHASAAALAKASLVPATLQTADIRLNGCPNSCGQHPAGTIGLSGAAQRVGKHLMPVYRVHLGARRGEGCVRLGEFIGIVPAKALPAFLVDLLKDFQASRSSAETFADAYDRKGQDHFRALLGRHAQAPDYHADPDFYRDWDRTEDFTLAGRGPGECGAGVFEVITQDLAVAAKTLEEAGTAAAPGESLFNALLATVRALLITRGVDSQNPDELLRAFEVHFVDTALVDSGFRGLLARGRGYREGWKEALLDRREEIRCLLDRIEHLFSTMDAELRFHVSEAAVTASPPADAPPAADSAAAPEDGAAAQAATVELDLRGVACPMNFVKARLRLEMMEVGSTLGVILDSGEPIQNVPASFRNEGQEILDTRAVDDRHWRVVIRKRNGCAS